MIATDLPTIVAVVGLIKKQNTFLMAQRPKNKSYSGQWEFPGGKIEANESSYAALKRELQEEIGIEVTQASHLFNHTHAYPDKIVLLELWLVEVFQGEPESREEQALRWATVAEMPKLNVLAGNLLIIDRITKMKL